MKIAGWGIPRSLLTTIGDTIYASAVSTPERLGIGAANTVYRVSGGIPSWSATLAGLTLTAPNIDGGTADSLTSLSIRSTGAAYDLHLATTAVYTASRTLTINIPVGANAALTLTGDLIRSGAHSLTLTTSAATDVTLPTTGTLATLAGAEALTAKTGYNGLVITANTGAITTGTWSATAVGADHGGTGVANNVASTLTISGNFATTLTVSAATGVTLPTTGTLATLAGTEALTNKTITLGGTLTATNQGIANATYLSTGASPSTTGAIRLSHGEAIRGRNSAGTADRRIFEWGVTATNVIAIGSDADAISLYGNTTLQAGITLALLGSTSGTVTVAVAAAAGTWTMTLPTGVAGVGGYQLTDAAGDGVCSWAAAGSRREWKNIFDLFFRPELVLTPETAYRRFQDAKVYPFTFKDGYGTGDYKTIYQGVMAEDAPFWMHFEGGILNPISTFGHTVLAFQAVEAKIAALEKELAELKGARV